MRTVPLEKLKQLKKDGLVTGAGGKPIESLMPFVPKSEVKEKEVPDAVVDGMVKLTGDSERRTTAMVSLLSQMTSELKKIRDTEPPTPDIPRPTEWTFKMTRSGRDNLIDEIHAKAIRRA